VGKKAVIILLVLCAALFLLALGSNWLPFTKESKEDFSLNDYGWLNGLDEWFSPFQKKVSLSRLKPRNCKVIKEGRYELNNDKSCIVAIDSVGESSNKADKNASALVINTKKKVTFLIPCKKGSRGLGAKEMIVLKPSVARIKAAVPAVRVPDTAHDMPGNLKVRVEFLPGNGNGRKEDGVCAQKPPAKLMVFDDGGLLKLTCPGCKANRTVEITLE
jgi:hypothetical protein